MPRRRYDFKFLASFDLETERDLREMADNRGMDMRRLIRLYVSAGLAIDKKRLKRLAERTDTTPEEKGPSDGT